MPPLEPEPEPPRSIRPSRRGLPEFASQVDRLAHHERHRLDSEQTLLDNNNARRRSRDAARAPCA
jgi:hypothetical protein